MRKNLVCGGENGKIILVLDAILKITVYIFDSWKFRE